MVFIDIDKKTWQPDVAQARRYIKKHPSEVVGILLCNIFGVGAPSIDDWEKLAKEFDLPMVIDSAAGFGSRYADGSRIGQRGDCEVFSFHATKPFSVGEGGAISATSPELIKKLRSLQNFGFGDTREVESIGFNAKMQEINAAIGLHQLESIDNEIGVRQSHLAWYKDILKGHKFDFQPNAENSTVCFVSVLAPDKKSADRLHAALKDGGVEISRYYNPPLHKHKAFKGFELADTLDVTEDFCSRILSLPAHTFIGDSERKLIDDIVGSAW